MLSEEEGKEVEESLKLAKEEGEKELSSAIETHIDILLDKEFLERVGADKQSHRDLSIRVMRIFESIGFPDN